LSQKHIKSYYRFYGARHSVLQLGYLIDFEEESDNANFLPRLRRVSHIGFPWLYEREKLLLWHRFIALFEPHLRDVEKIDSFYYETLLEAAKKWHKQSSKRLIVESFVKILEYEGRLYPTNRCIVCNKEITEEQFNLVNSLMPTHTFCSKGFEFTKEAINMLFAQKSTINLEDSEVEKLLPIILKGF